MSHLGIAAVAFLGAATFAGALALGAFLERVLGQLQARYVLWASKLLAGVGWPVGLRTFATRHALLVGGAVGLALATGRSAGGILTAAALAGAAPLLWARRAREKRMKQLELQLEPGLQILANAVLATQNLVDGFETLAQHGSPPLSEEAALLVKEVRVGAHVDEALLHLAERCGNRHVDAVITALGIGRRTGGDLPKILEQIAHIVRETLRLEGMIASKTAEGRASGWMMAAMPFGFGLVVNTINPEWMAPLFNDPIGTAILVVACLLTFAGAALIRKISTIDV